MFHMPVDRLLDETILGVVKVLLHHFDALVLLTLYNFARSFTGIAGVLPAGHAGPVGFTRQYEYIECEMTFHSAQHRNCETTGCKSMALR